MSALICRIGGREFSAGLGDLVHQGLPYDSDCSLEALLNCNNCVNAMLQGIETGIAQSCH